MWGETPEIPEIPVTGAPALFVYGERMRRRFEELLNATPEDMTAPHQFTGHGRKFRMSHRKTVFMLLIQAARNAGFDPPGQHDFFFSGAME